MSDIEKQLKAARETLLDLTMRNRLLNFRPGKSRTLRIVDEIPREIYDILVLNEKSMGFRPTQEKTRQSGEQAKLDLSIPSTSKENETGLPNEEAQILWEAPSSEVEVAELHVDRFLQTALDPETLQKRLFYISQEARSVVEEQGYTILYLALGFLEWTENLDSQPRLAPLILVPVELERARVRSIFKLRWTGEDIFTNISLKAKLAEQSVSLPDVEMPDDKTEIDSYLQSVSKAISSMPNWKVKIDVYLGFFSFTKFVMYKDLDPASWPKDRSPAEHPLIKAIFDPSSSEINKEPGFNEEDVDTKLQAHNIYHVMDADPSQIAVIEDAKSGRNLAVEGPPGTGKSQTITNIVAELLASGKIVLFVSEKMAALEVVKNRLDQVGLGDFCLELHSRKANKKEVLKELEKTILGSPRPQPISEKSEYDQLEDLKCELNNYAKALREPFGKFGRSPFALYCMRESANRHFEKTGYRMPSISFLNLEECGQDEYVKAISRLKNLAEISPLVAPVNKHPWYGCKLGVVLPSDEEEIGKSLDQCLHVIEELKKRIDTLNEATGIKCAGSLADLVRALSAAELVEKSYRVERHVLLNAEWNEQNKQAERLISKLEEWNSYTPQVFEKFKSDALGSDTNYLLNEFKTRSRSIFRIFNKDYRRVRREILNLYQGKPPKGSRRILSDLESLTICARLRKEVRSLNQDGTSLFGSLWQDERSDREMLKAFSAWIVSFRKAFLAGILTEQSVGTVSAGLNKEAVKIANDSVSEKVTQFIELRDHLTQRLGIDHMKVFGKSDDQVTFSELTSRIRLWRQEIAKLRRWVQYVLSRDECLDSLAASIIDLVENDSLKANDLIPCFEGNFAEGLLRLAFKERSVLASFDGELHLRKIQRFSDLDRKLIELNRRRLKQKLYEMKPYIFAGVSAGSEAGILMAEFNKKRRHLPIRKLMFQAGGLIQKIKPCFMMSPLSIAQFLDPRSIQFDVVIFDEASQVRPADALGALLRGRQAVVLGDTRQLPPTSFFDHMVEATDEEVEEFTVADVDSILHLSRQSFPLKTLRWHYRSKHETLVAVSNQEFYDNRLLIYPSPVDKDDRLGLKFVHIPDSVYDRGRSQINRKEAQEVAKVALEHYRNFPNKSLGVGTFNIKQQEAILEEIELQLRLHPEMEDFFSSSRPEHFFVKNLETIQGDERDVIFLSIGYGFDETRRLTLNFGPLNHEGGWRRLNVLITRARQRCVVFSNFRASDLQLDSSVPLGLRALKIFLDYAENRKLHAIEVTEEGPESPFEDSVYDFLRSNGYEVRKQVGCAGFRVDLAIIDPHSPGRYLLGIECDGSKYHTSPVARDRDRLRQQILEGLGWRIYRVWSTDWYRNRKETQGKLLDAINRIKQGQSFDPVIELNVSNPVSASPDPPGGANDESSSRNDHSNVVVEDSIGAKVPIYKVCSALPISVRGELYEQSAEKLALAVTKVVEVEGPVHFEEVVRRIRSLWGLERAGDRIKASLRKGAKFAERQGKIRREGKFLWPTADRSVPVRRRVDDPPPKIELICDEEIGEAIKLVLRHQHATLAEDLAIQTSRVLGIQATRSEAADRVESVILLLLENGELQRMPNGMIHFEKS